MTATQDKIRLILTDLREEATGRLYAEVAARLRLAIEDGRLKVSEQLPSERLLCQETGLSRTTVQAAYGELEALGFLRTRRGIGTFVAARPAQPFAAATGLKHAFADRAGPLGDPLLGELMHAAASPAGCSFETGSPDPSLLPQEELGLVLQEILGRRSGQVFAYSPTEGLDVLRRAIAEGLLPLRGFGPVAADEVLVVSGAMQGLDLIGKLFLEPGDAVLVENPTFPGALQAFRGAGARLVGVPTDAGGVDIAALDALAQRMKPKLAYLQPTLHNPTGVTLAADRRARLLGIARRHRFAIVEDDAYGLLHPAPATAPPLKAEDTDGVVIHLGSVSKILSPGLRVGYLVADRGVLRALARIKQTTDLHTSTLSQSVLEGWLRIGDVPGHLARARSLYAERLVALLAELDRLEPRIRPLHRPAGGFYAFCRLPFGLTAAQLRRRAAERGVGFVPGEAFAPDGSGGDCLRLCISAEPTTTIVTGVRRLTRLLGELERDPSGGRPRP